MKYKLMKNKLTGERSIKNTESGKRISEKENPVEYTRLRKLAINNIRKASRHEAMTDLGLVRVKGALGGVYYE